MGGTLTEESPGAAAPKSQVIVFVGNARPAEYRFFRENGHRLVLLHDPFCPIAYPDEGAFDEIISTSFDDPTLDKVLNHLLSRYDVTALVAAVETAVLDNARLAARLGLPAPTQEAAACSLDKGLMRDRFRRHLGAGCTSASRVVADLQELLDFVGEVGYPIVLKPTNMFGSMFVTVSSDHTELVDRFARACDKMRDHLDLTGRPDEPVAIQAETFLVGSSHSVDVVVDCHGRAYPTELVDVLTERDFGAAAKVQHFARLAPSTLSADAQAVGKRLAVDAVAALGLSACLAHVEFIQTADGPKLLEVAARPGGNRAHLMKEVFGIELMGAYHAALTGQPIHVDRQFLRPRAIMTFYPRRIGAFLAVRHEHEAALRALDGFVRLGVGVAPGETVGPADEGFLPTVSAEVTADSIDDLLATVRTAHNLGDIVEVSSF